VATYRLLLLRGEIGLQAPLGANEAGPDCVTAAIDAAGQATIYVNDTKMSTRGRFPTPATAIPLTWADEVRAAIAPGRLDLGDPLLEAAIRQAFAAGRVQIRQRTTHRPAAAASPASELSRAAECRACRRSGHHRSAVAIYSGQGKIRRGSRVPCAISWRIG
jgi:hypothetical protein